MWAAMSLPGGPAQRSTAASDAQPAAAISASHVKVPGRRRTIRRSLAVDYLRAGRSGAVTLLVLLAGPAPTGVVPADVLLVGLDDLPRAGRNGAAARHGARRHRAGRTARRRDRLRARERLVLVLQPRRRRPVSVLHRERLLCDRRLELRVEEHQDDLLADGVPELAKHPVALVPVL